VPNRISRAVAVAAACALAASASPQDPTKLLPDSYKLQFENEWVRVTRVHYAPDAKLPVHAHTTAPSAYVYLNDAGPVIFKHVGASYGTVERPATVARAFRLYKNVGEVHEVENLNDTPSDFLRVEFKTEPLGEATLRGRYFPPDYPPGENFAKVHFENEQVRITRRACAPGKACDLSPSPSTPALLVAVTTAHFRSAAGEVGLALGQTEWMSAGAQRMVENRGPAPAEVLLFEFKTKPVPESSAAHAH
jgi:hypothetical protein